MSNLAEIFWCGLYVGLALVGAIFGYLFYNMVYRTNRARKALRKYPNVYMSPRASYLGGDMTETIGGIVQDKRHMFSRGEEAILDSNEKYDMLLQTAGPQVIIGLCSTESLEEFKNAVPHSIDRTDAQKEIFGKSFMDSYVFMRSTENWSLRRKYLMSKLGIQQVSKKIPLILKSLEERFSKVRTGERFDLSTAFDEVTMCVIAKTLFGEDADDQTYTVLYERLNGTEVQVPLFSALREIGHDTMVVGLSALNFLFPFFPKYNIGSHNRMLRRNVERIHQQVKKLMKNSKDRDSVCSLALAEGKVPEEELFQDLMNLLFAGFDTSSRTATATIYELRKNPECRKQLA